MAHLPNPDDDPMSVYRLIDQRINKDPHVLVHFESAEEVEDVLADLEADGHAKQLKDGWKNTPEGFEILTGPPAEGGPEGPAVMGLDLSGLTDGGS